MSCGLNDRNKRSDRISSQRRYLWCKQMEMNAFSEKGTYESSRRFWTVIPWLQVWTIRFLHDSTFFFSQKALAKTSPMSRFSPASLLSRFKLRFCDVSYDFAFVVVVFMLHLATLKLLSWRSKRTKSTLELDAGFTCCIWRGRAKASCRVHDDWTQSFSCSSSQWDFRDQRRNEIATKLKYVTCSSMLATRCKDSTKLRTTFISGILSHSCDALLSILKRIWLQYQVQSSYRVILNILWKVLT